MLRIPIAAALPLAGLISLNSCKPDQPNVVIILADDQGWGDISYNGNINVSTPNIDRFARQGTSFDRFYVAPMSSPTRAGLLTGRYHYRSGVYGTTDPAQFMDLDETTLADIFKEGGYATGCFGKWHNGSQFPYNPNGRGFTHFYGFYGGHRSNYFNPFLFRNETEVRGTGYIADNLADSAMAFIEKYRSNRFLCYIPFNIPHNPMQVPDEYYDRVKERGIKMVHRNPEEEDTIMTIAALAMCENLDWNVGRILKKIDDLDLAEKTIVIYLSDNGPAFWRWNGDMKGRKGSVDEGGVRVPCFVRWPGVIPAGKTISENAAYIDILPTLADFAGLSVDKCKPLDGISLKPILTGKTDRLPERLLFSSLSRRSSVRKGPYIAGDGYLYDLKTDPGQRNNLNTELPVLYRELTDTLAKWYADAISDIDSNRYYHVGYKEYPTAILPVEDVRLHRSKKGNIAYSASITANTFIRNWDDTSSYASWKIQVNTTGDYEVILAYTCEEENTGCEFEFSYEGNKLKGNITEAFNPPFIESPDRVERTTQSFEKQFKPLKVGILNMKEGQGRLILRSLKMPGEKMMDVKSVTLKLI